MGSPAKRNGESAGRVRAQSGEMAVCSALNLSVNKMAQDRYSLQQIFFVTFYSL
jgi:hypothetical protein